MRCVSATSVSHGGWRTGTWCRTAEMDAEAWVIGLRRGCVSVIDTHPRRSEEPGSTPSVPWAPVRRLGPAGAGDLDVDDIDPAGAPGQLLVDVLGAGPLGRQQEQGAAVGPAQHAGEAATVEADRVDDLAALPH